MYELIAFRKLNHGDKKNIVPKLKKFVKENVGKKYDLNAGKILKFETDFDWETVNDERGYFCS